MYDSALPEDVAYTDYNIGLQPKFYPFAKRINVAGERWL